MKRPGSAVLSCIAIVALSVALFTGCSVAPAPEAARPAAEGRAAEAPAAHAMTVAGGTASFVAISDIHLDDDGTVTCTYDQAKDRCDCSDTARNLWASTQDELAAVLASCDSKPGFIVYTGDLPEHDVSGDTLHGDQGAVLKGLRTVAEDLGVPLVYLPGNNDSQNGDYCPFTTKDAAGNAVTPLDLDGGSANGWPLVGGNGTCDATASNKPCIVDTQNAEWGYFSAYPLANNPLRVIALNTAVVSTNTMCDDQLDITRRTQVVGDQLDWLENEMKDAEHQGDRVLVAMHVPPGFDGYSGNPSWRKLSLAGNTNPRDRFLGIMRQYQPITMGTLTAHSHLEEIRRLYGEDDQGNCDASPFGVALSVPGITPPHGNNPALKVLHYDSALELVDYEVYYRPLEEDCHWNPWQSFGFQDVNGCSASTVAACVQSLGTSGLVDYENTKGYYGLLSGRATLKHTSMFDVKPTTCP